MIRMRNKPIGPLRIGLLYFLGCLFALTCSMLQAAGPNGSIPEAVVALQETIVDSIESVEPSVVAVLRSKRQPAANANRVRQSIIVQQRLGGLAEIPDPLTEFRATGPKAPPYAFGSGVVIDNSGLVLTQYLVVDKDDDHEIVDYQGNSYQATILAADPRSGLAILKIDQKQLAKVRKENPQTLPALKIGNAEELRKGDFIIAIGNPYAIRSDGQPTTSWGTVSNIARKATPQENLNNTPDDRGTFRTTIHHFGTLIQTDAKLGWNAGGGAVVNLAGELVGITTTAATITGHEQPAGYAIPLNKLVRRAIKDLSDGREVEYGLLGVTFNSGVIQQGLPPGVNNPWNRARPLNQPAAPVEVNKLPNGVFLDQAYVGSPGYKGGLRSGDLITQIGTYSTPNADALLLAVSQFGPGDEIAVEYFRGSSKQTTSITLGKAFVLGDKIVTKPKPAWRGMRVDYSTALPGNLLRQASLEGKIDPRGCVVVTEVLPGSVADKYGVKPYMFISHIGDNRVSTPEEFYQLTKNDDATMNLKFTSQVESSKE